MVLLTAVCFSRSASNQPQQPKAAEANAALSTEKATPPEPPVIHTAPETPPDAAVSSVT